MNHNNYPVYMEFGYKSMCSESGWMPSSLRFPTNHKNTILVLKRCTKNGNRQNIQCNMLLSLHCCTQQSQIISKSEAIFLNIFITIGFFTRWTIVRNMPITWAIYLLTKLQNCILMLPQSRTTSIFAWWFYL